MKLVIFGARQIAEIAYTYFTHDSPYEVVAFSVDADLAEGPTFEGLPVVPFESITESHPPSEYELFIALSYRKLNSLRRQKYLEAKQKGYRLASYVSSKATVWPGVAIGDNAFILEHNNLQPQVRIGNNVTLWSGNHIGHHSVIQDHVFIASHAVVSGNVVVGESSFVGVNATLRDGISIGRDNIIGAGALILGNTNDGEVYSVKGTPVSPVPSHKVKL